MHPPTPPPESIRLRLREMLGDALVYTIDPDGTKWGIPSGADAGRIRQIHALAQTLSLSVVDVLAEALPPELWLLAPQVFLQCAAPDDWDTRARLFLCDCLDRLHGGYHPAAAMLRTLLHAEDPRQAQAMRAVAWQAIQRCGLATPHSPEAVLFLDEMTPEGVALLASASMARAPQHPSADQDVKNTFEQWFWPQLLHHAQADLFLDKRRRHAA